MSSNPAITIGVSAQDSASKVLQGLDSQVLKTAGGIETSSDRIAAKTTTMSERLKGSYGSLAQTITGLTAGIVGFVTSFDTLTRAQHGADKATLSYNRAVEELKKKQDDGKTSAADLANAQEKVRLTAEAADLAQDRMHDTYANFLANVPAQMVSFGVSASSVLTMLRTNHVAAGAAAVTHSVTYSGALTSMNVANTTTTISTNTLSTALKAAFLTNPVGLIIMGVATAAILLATNFDKVQAAVTWLASAVFDFLEKYFKPLADAIRWFNDNVLKPLGQGLGITSEQTSKAADAQQYLGEVVTDTGDAIQKTSDKIQTYNDYLNEVSDSTYKSTTENIYYLQSVGQLELAQNKTNEQIEFAASFLRDLERDASKAREENFRLVATYTDLDTALGMTNEQLAAQAAHYKGLVEQAHELDKVQSAIAKGSVEERGKKSGLLGSGAKLTGSSGQTSYFVEQHAHGGTIYEPTAMLGLISGRRGIMAENGPETISKGIGGASNSNVIVNFYDYGANVEIETIIGDQRTRELKTRKQALLGTAIY